MQKGKFNVVTDGQYGSTGKGLINSVLAWAFRPDIISTTNMPNAGHTAVNSNGEKWIAKALPSSAILNAWLPNYKPAVVVGPTASFDIDQLFKEIGECKLSGNLFIHPRAGVVTAEHKQAENDGQNATKHVASTMQGCGTFLADKILRKQNLKLAKDYVELAPFVNNTNYHKDDISQIRWLFGLLEDHWTVLHEGSQGFSLDISHGQSYPNCTSRSTTAMQNMTDMGIHPSKLGDVYLVIRPYPIRVGNVIENGVQLGYSGGCYDDQKEITWEEVAANAGAPSGAAQDLREKELTTVTKRLRRVFTFSATQLVEAVIANGATKIALNFANYIDWSCSGTNDWSRLPTKVLEFVNWIQEVADVPVAMVGTGPQINHICYNPSVYGFR